MTVANDNVLDRLTVERLSRMELNEPNVFETISDEEFDEMCKQCGVVGLKEPAYLTFSRGEPRMIAGSWVCLIRYFKTLN